jgi:amino-acid N-acetyltransferase
VPTIAAASVSTLDEVVALLDAVGLPHDDLTEAALRHFRVLRDDGRMCGVVGVEPVGASALLRSLAVRPSERGNGYGHALVRAAEAYAREQGVGTLYLLTTTAPDFFAGLGYERMNREEVPPAIAQTDEFDRLCPRTAACMQKSLIS